MTDVSVLMYADTVRSPDLRHRIPHSVADPFLYIEHEGVAHVVVRSLELERMQGVDGIVAHAEEEFGLDEMRAAGVPAAQRPRRIALEACRRLGVGRAAVPPEFPVGLADHLRDGGVVLEVSDTRFSDARRSKTAAQLAGIRRAQRGAEAAVRAISALLAASQVSGQAVLLDGEPLTCERLKVAARQAFAEHSVAAEDLIVAHGAQTCIGHHMGSGEIRAGEPITVDLWPRDEESGCFTDMTRTFVVGEIVDELRKYHALSREALDRSIAAIRPGVRAEAVFAAACEVFEAAGQPTQRTKQPGQILLDGFFHSLGHGVGLEVHEAPHLAAGDDVLVEGDVLAVEPGCYRQGFGGARLEDLVIVTASGAEVVTDFAYELTPR
ncbi:MAG: M24 family metallopeptidase [Solirubrobacteraceae bacterium]